MVVYRLCKKDEINIILDNLGFTNLKDKRNLHFFKDSDSIFYMSTNKDTYICTYDIPEEILNDGFRIGKYLDYFRHQHNIMVTEYVVSIDKMDFEYLKRVERLTSDVSIADYMNDDTLTNFKETIYKRKSDKNLVKKNK